jgi:hypothetical protein
MPELPVVQYSPGTDHDPSSGDGDWSEAIFHALPPPEEEPEPTPEERRYLEFYESTGTGQENYASDSGMTYSISVGEVCRFDESRRHIQVALNCPHGIGRQFRAEYGEPQKQEPGVPPVRTWRRYGSI